MSGGGRGPLWAAMDDRPRIKAAGCGRSDLPASPGVYAWYRDGEPVYVGRAITGGGIGARLRTHLATGTDLSHSSLRRNVCAYLGIANTAVTRTRPSVMSIDQVAMVNAWVAGCEIAWIECTTAEGAAALETAIKAEWKPPLTHR